jgi:hypothetical protein
MSPDANEQNTDKQENGEHAQALLLVNALPFHLAAKSNDYTLYQTQKQRQMADIAIDIFLEQVPDSCMAKPDERGESLSSQTSAFCPLHKSAYPTG